MSDKSNLPPDFATSLSRNIIARLQLRLADAIADKKAGSAVAKGYGATKKRHFAA